MSGRGACNIQCILITIIERILAQTERPADIVRRRLDQAGYGIEDGLDLLGADDIQFLMKFVYKSNVLGPAVRSFVHFAFCLLMSFIGGRTYTRLVRVHRFDRT